MRLHFQRGYIKEIVRILRLKVNQKVDKECTVQKEVMWDHSGLLIINFCIGHDRY